VGSAVTGTGGTGVLDMEQEARKSTISVGRHLSMPIIIAPGAL
jgi:hypothetical protein